MASLMNATGNFKEPVTVDDLLGKSEAKQSIDMEKIRERAERRKQERLAERQRQANEC